MLGISEVAILIIVAVLVFGAKKLPELARSAGKSARILKSEVRAMKADKNGPPTAEYTVRPLDDEPGNKAERDQGGAARSA